MRRNTLPAFWHGRGGLAKLARRQVTCYDDRVAATDIPHVAIGGYALRSEVTIRAYLRHHAGARLRATGRVR